MDRLLSRIRIGARRSRTDQNTEETGLRDRLSVFSTSYDAAGNGCHGSGGTGGTLRLGKQRPCKESNNRNRAKSWCGFHLALLRLLAEHLGECACYFCRRICTHLLPNGNTVFQSFFMSTTVQPSACAASSALSRRPMEEVRS
jgi:hypothetical protein